MPDAPQRRRLVSPALLLAVLLCFFLPFFSVSCSSGFGQMEVSVTGMDQVVGGEPEYSGFRPPPSTAASGGENSRVSPFAVVALLAVVVGIGAGLGLPRPRARRVWGAAAAGVGLVAVVANQVALHARAREAFDGAGASFRSQVGSNPFLGGSIPTPALELHDEAGFWLAAVLLAAAVAFNAYELAVAGRTSSSAVVPRGTPPVTR